MITDIKKQTRKEYEENSWIFVEPIKQFDRLRILTVDYKPSEDRLLPIRNSWAKNSWLLFIPQPIERMPF
jgi:hypothetical protein